MHLCMPVACGCHALRTTSCAGIACLRHSPASPRALTSWWKQGSLGARGRGTRRKKRRKKEEGQGERDGSEMQVEIEMKMNKDEEKNKGN